MVELWKSLLAIVSAMQAIAVEGNKLDNNYLNEFECPIFRHIVFYIMFYEKYR